MDSSFKRVPTRKCVASLTSIYLTRTPLIIARRIEEITKELNDLRAAVDLSRAPVTPATLELYSTEGHQSRSLPRAPSSSNRISDSNAVNAASAPWLQLDRSQENESRSLERIVLTPQAVLELLE